MMVFSSKFFPTLLIASLLCACTSSDSSNESNESTTTSGTNDEATDNVALETSVTGTTSYPSSSISRTILDDSIEAKSIPVTFATDETGSYELCLLSSNISQPENVSVLVYTNFGSDSEVVSAILNSNLTITEIDAGHRVCFQSSEAIATYQIVESESAPAGIEVIEYTVVIPPPTLQSTSIKLWSVVLTYSEALDETSVPAPGDFTLGGDISGDSITDITISGTDVILELATGIPGSDSASVSYTPGANPIRSASGGVAQQIASLSATNNGAMSWTYPANVGDKLAIGLNLQNEHHSAAINDSGETVVAWNSTSGPNPANIFVADYRSETWNLPAVADTLSSDDGVFGSETLDIAIDNAGNVVVAWFEHDGGFSRVYKAEYRNGSWSTPASESDFISIGDYNCSWPPSVAMDNNGQAIIAWRQNTAGDSHSFKAEYRNGTWSYPTDINDFFTPTGAAASTPSVAMDDNNQAIIAWTQSDDTNSQVLFSEYRNGTWAHPPNRATNISPDGSDTSDVRLAMNNNNEALIVWRQDDLSGNDALFKSEYRSGTWAHPTNNRNDNFTTDSYSVRGGNTEIALADNGDAVVIYVQTNGSNHQLFKSEYRSGSWTHPVDINDEISFTGHNIQKIDVDMDKRGNTVIAWTQGTPGVVEMFVAERKFGGSWDLPDDINDYAPLPAVPSSRPLSVNVSNSGEVVIVWETGSEVYKNEYR